DGRGSRCPQRGDVPRIHEGKWHSIFGVTKNDDALNGRKAMPWVPGKIRIQLCGEVRRQRSCLDMEAALRQVHAQHTGRNGLALPMNPEGLLDGGDALVESEQRVHVSC